MESSVVRGARVVAVTTDRLRARLVAQYPTESCTKFRTIPNGFDPDDFAGLPAVTPSDRFLVTHVGSLYYRRSALAFLEAAAALIRSGEVPVDQLQIAFVGNPPEDGGVFRHAVETLGLHDAVEHLGRMPQQDVFAWMRRSSLLLLLAQDQPLQIPSKTFEYLASGTPILAVTADGATADLVAWLGGYVAHDTAAEIIPLLRRCYLAHRAGAETRPVAPWAGSPLREFDRRGIAAQFATLLDGIIC
jgi:glycosyltransferase involved in cell wall biosynthesis